MRSITHDNVRIARQFKILQRAKKARMMSMKLNQNKRKCQTKAKQTCCSSDGVFSAVEDEEGSRVPDVQWHCSSGPSDEY